MNLPSIQTSGAVQGSGGYSAYSRVDNISATLSSGSILSASFDSDSDSVTLTMATTTRFDATLYSAESTTGGSTGAVNGESSSVASLSAETESYLTEIRERVAALVEQAAQKTADYRRQLWNGSGLYSADGSSQESAMAFSVEETETVSLTVDASYFNAENTAARIVQFALSFYTGGDREEFVAMVREAIMEGFEQAQAIMGGTLPEVSYDTMTIANQMLDEFAAGGAVA